MNAQNSLDVNYVPLSDMSSAGLLKRLKTATDGQSQAKQPAPGATHSGHGSEQTGWQRSASWVVTGYE